MPATAQQAVFLVRHGEKELSGTDPALIPEGRHRADNWARMLRNAKLEAIVTSDASESGKPGA
ncbi:histidine phosphatase family protein [Ruegeria marina]|uniref:histidine phosphatase family protein n=1 Tax=Ruegeria marina TaxID=639004 RepID=UPI003CCC3913